MLDIINRKISGLCTLVLEENTYKQGFTNRNIYKWDLYRVDYPEGHRVLLQRFEHTDYAIIEADTVEFLFDILISERYTEWKNFDLVQENVE